MGQWYESFIVFNKILGCIKSQHGISFSYKTWYKCSKVYHHHIILFQSKYTHIITRYNVHVVYTVHIMCVLCVYKSMCVCVCVSKRIIIYYTYMSIIIYTSHIFYICVSSKWIRLTSSLHNTRAKIPRARTLNCALSCANVR